MSTSRAAGLFLALVLVQACGDSDEPLPPVHQRTLPDTCAAFLPPPPPSAGLELAVITRGADPAHCLPPDVRRKGLLVDVELSAGGHPVSVTAVRHMCVVIGPDGNVQPQFALSPAAEECILEDLRSWRFAAGSPCHVHGTVVHLSEKRNERPDTVAFHASGTCAG